MSIRAVVAAALPACLLVLGACEAGLGGDQPPPPVAAGPAAATDPAAAPDATGRRGPRFTIRRAVEHGRIEDHGGLRVLRLWGDPQQRGRAHARLVGAEAVGLLRRELSARFGTRPKLLQRARQLLPLLVGFPKPFRAELEALFAGIAEQDIDRDLPEFGRALDLEDVLLINAMDLVVQVGCSGFTVWDEQVAGGGVLTARNFDWPLTGDYLLASCCLMVHHPADGAAFAAVSWPGYIGAITGVNEHGVAAFLHVGDSAGRMPRPGSHPTAAAARGILRQAEPESAFEIGRDLLGRTCPPRGFITRVVLPTAGSDYPVRVFEADGLGVTHRRADRLCVVTNHFLSRTREPERSDSLQRFRSIRSRLQAELDRGDRAISVDEAWAALVAVESSGRQFGTLHSLVFRHHPWVFELAIGRPDDDGGIRAAPSHGARYRLGRAAVFAPIR